MDNPNKIPKDTTSKTTQTTETAEVAEHIKKQYEQVGIATLLNTVEIVCVDCQATRTIAKQEAFQVKRCVSCQEAYRKEQRKVYRKNRMLNLKTRVQLLENLLLTNNISIPA